MWHGMKICEIFTSLDGEGQHRGKLTTFIRLSGCNLNCEWCDTKYHTEYTDMGIDEIVSKIKTKRVTITGGEPLLQEKELLELLKKLEDNDVVIFTNGTIKLSNVIDKAKIVMDLKIGEVEYLKIRQGNIELLGNNDILKIVMDDMENIKLKLFLEMFKECGYKCKLQITPAWGMIEPKQIAEHMILNRLEDIELTLQQHKYIWEPDKRGV